MPQKEVSMSDSAPTLVAPSNCEACYVELDGRIYYLDNSTGEVIVDSWERVAAANAAERSYQCTVIH
jgi:hypothetical protein